MATDVAGQAQANWFKQATVQANNPPNPGTTTRQSVQKRPTIIRTVQPMPVPPSFKEWQTGGLFNQNMMPNLGMPQNNGGLMDFNLLAQKLAGPQGPPMDDRSALIRRIFSQGLPSQMAKEVGSGRDRDKEKKLYMLSPMTGTLNYTNQALGLPSLFK